MRLNRFILFSLTLLVTLAFAAAAAQDVDWEAELGDHDGKTLRIIMIQDPWVGAFDAINERFEEITGANVIIESFGYDQTYQQEVLIGDSGSDEFDVVVLDSPWIGQFAEGDFVDDLTPLIEADADVVQFEDFVPAFQEVSRWNDEIVGIPFGAYFILQHYREDLYEQAGREPATTIEEFRDNARFFTENAGEYGLRAGTALNNQRGAPIGQAYFEYIFNFGGKPFESMYPGSPDPYADMTPLLDSPESIAVVEFFIEMLEYQPPGAENFAWDQRATTFGVGQTAAINAWSVRTPGLTNPEQSRVTDSFATALFPAVGGEPVPPLGGWVMGINAGSAQKDLAWDYIKWFTSPEIHKAFVLEGGPPSRLSTLADPEVLEAQPWAATIDASQQLAYAEARPRIPEAFEIIDTIGFYISQAVQGQLDVEEAMRQADEAVAQLLRDNGYNVNQ